MLYGSEKDWFCRGMACVVWNGQNWLCRECVCCMEVRKTGFVVAVCVVWK